MHKLTNEIKLANSNTPQHNIHELANQLLVFERLNNLHEERKLSKCMLSAYLHMTKDYRANILKYAGMHCNSIKNTNVNEPIAWLRSCKLPPEGEALADKGFENTDRFFANFNRTRCPRVLRNREVKQCDAIEL